MTARLRKNQELTTMEKILSRAGVNIMTLVAIVFSAGIFYQQNESYHSSTEERFSTFSKQRETQAEQLDKFNDALNKTTVQLSALTERMNAQTDVIKDIRDLLRGKTLK